MAPQATADDEAARSAAIERMVDQHAGAVYRLARSIVRDAGLADDVVQETMLKAWRVGPVDPDGTIPRAWLLKVARNTAISYLRTRREDSVGSDSLLERPTGTEVARMVESRAELDEVLEALHQLDPDARSLILLHEVDGLSYEEMAEALDLPLPTVKTRLFRARRSLKSAVEAWR